MASGGGGGVGVWAGRREGCTNDKKRGAPPAKGSRNEEGGAHISPLGSWQYSLAGGGISREYGGRQAGQSRPKWARLGVMGKRGPGKGVEEGVGLGYAR